MKPEWKDAPKWANWLCKDHGQWYWTENTPGWDGGVIGYYQVAGEYNEGVSEAPEPRPV